MERRRELEAVRGTPEVGLLLVSPRVHTPHHRLPHPNKPTPFFTETVKAMRGTPEVWVYTFCRLSPQIYPLICTHPHTH